MFGFFHSKKDKKRQQETLSSIQKLSNISFLYYYTKDRDIFVAAEAAKRIHKLWQEKRQLPSAHLYADIRYVEISKADIASFQRFGLEIQTSLYCIASMNCDGYVREVALERIQTRKATEVLPFVLYRLADWVAVIRNKAEEIVSLYLQADNAFVWIRNYRLVQWLLQVKRNNLTILYQQIISFLAKHDLEKERLLDLLDGERFFYYNIRLAREGFDANLLTQISQDRCCILRLQVIKHLTKTDNPLLLLKPLLRDHSKKVVWAAIQKVGDKQVVGCQEELYNLIFHEFSAIRYTARKLLDTIRTVDYQRLYKENISQTNRMLPGSLLGFSEFADASEVEMILPFLQEKRAKIQQAALLAVFKLVPELAIEHSYQLFTHPSSTRSKKRAALLIQQYGIDPIRIRSIYERTDLKGKRFLLRLLYSYGGWSIAGDFLKAMCIEQDKTIVGLAKALLNVWLQYTVRLGTSHSKEDKEYTLKWYNKAQELQIDVPQEIAFIFR
ncbi:MAG: hypothetical protein AAF518_11475 [Spirochaetota bacterium]